MIFADVDGIVGYSLCVANFKDWKYVKNTLKN